eukprot:6460870-Amphidinium_carterae.2
MSLGSLQGPLSFSSAFTSVSLSIPCDMRTACLPHLLCSCYFSCCLAGTHVGRGRDACEGTEALKPFQGIDSTSVKAL